MSLGLIIGYKCCPLLEVKTVALNILGEYKNNI